MWLGFQVLIHAMDSDGKACQAQPNVAGHNESGPDGSPADLLRSTRPETNLPLLKVTSADLSPLPISFESMLLRMQAQGDIYCEGDGSFVFCGNQPPTNSNRQIAWLGKNPGGWSQEATPGWTEAESPQGHPSVDDRQNVVWRIEGNLVDGGDWLDHIQVIGFAPADTWRTFLNLISHPNQQQILVFQVQQFGFFVPANEVLAQQ